MPKLKRHGPSQLSQRDLERPAPSARSTMSVGMGRALFERIRLLSCAGPHQRSSVLALSSQLPSCTRGVRAVGAQLVAVGGIGDRRRRQRDLGSVRRCDSRRAPPSSPSSRAEGVEVAQQPGARRRYATRRAPTSGVAASSASSRARTRASAAATAALVAKCVLGVRRARSARRRAASAIG